MKVITTDQQFRAAIKRMASSNPTFFYLASYKIRIDKDFDKILKLLPKKCDIKILIGAGEATNRKQIAFYKNYFKEHNVKLVNESHLKLVITNNSVIVGGRNYIGSSWEDYSLELVTPAIIKSAKSHFNKVFNKKRSLI